MKTNVHNCKETPQAGSLNMEFIDREIAYLDKDGRFWKICGTLFIAFSYAIVATSIGVALVREFGCL